MTSYDSSDSGGWWNVFKKLILSLGIAQVGERVRVFICEVGFVEGIVVRQTGTFVGIRFNLIASTERDLLIRRLFTSGLDTTNVSVSVWLATGAMFKSIWQVRTEMPEPGAADVGGAPGASPIAKLPLRSLVIAPRPQTAHLSDLSAERKSMAA
jgi:hypothetical protein